MPIYEFLCRQCKQRFEALVLPGNAPVICPHCGAAMLDKQISIPAPMSRGVRRQADHTCCGRQERCQEPPCSSSGRCRRG